MTMKRSCFKTAGPGALAFALTQVSAPAVLAQEAPIVQPGAPGEAARQLSASEAAVVANAGYTIDDVRFMQDMIPHHHQAVVMAALVADRTNNDDIINLAGRIDKSQAGEIAFMREWLVERGEDAPDPEAGHGAHDHGDHDHGDGHGRHATHMSAEMMGMASPEQLAALEAAEGVAFDKLFLELMIPHHRGAVTMVRELHRKAGSAYDPVLYEFTNDVVNDQTAEIERMNALRAGLTEDPRVGLAAGFRDAGAAIANLTLVASLPKPAGFFDPENPAGLPPVKETEDDEAAAEGDEDAEEAEEVEEVETQWGERSSLLSFWNTDMAFSDDLLIAGNYHGFNIYRLDDDGVPGLVTSVVCPGGQGDVSIVGDLLIMSVEQTRGRIDCGAQGVSEDVSAERFRGLRIFDVSDLAAPRQVGLVQTCRGSHTHSVVSADDDRIVVYNSGTSSVREDEELEGCIGDVPGDDRTALFSIDVIEIPLADPSQARITSSPRVFADDETGQIAGLWRGGDHGEGTQNTRPTDECHDITVFPEANIAAGACSGNGILLDISDPLNPVRIDSVVDQGFAYWHSATFNNDGDKVLFTDEWGGGGQARCRASDPATWGANAFYDVVDGELVFRSHYKIPAVQTDEENCVAHNGSIVPVPGRDIFAQAWYQGGLSVIDFTDSATPVEIAYFDRGPVHPDRMVVGGYWSTYWYGGKIYGTAMIRGLDVLSLEPSAHLTENEIAAAKLADQGAVFNPQQQFRVTWPDAPVVAKAYIDQLVREDTVTSTQVDAMFAALDEAETQIAAGADDAALAERLEEWAAELASIDVDTGAGAERVAALRGVLSGIANGLRPQ